MNTALVSREAFLPMLRTTTQKPRSRANRNSFFRKLVPDARFRTLRGTDTRALFRAVIVYAVNGRPRKHRPHQVPVALSPPLVFQNKLFFFLFSLRFFFSSYPLPAFRVGRSSVHKRLRKLGTECFFSFCFRPPPLLIPGNRKFGTPYLK